MKRPRPFCPGCGAEVTRPGCYCDKCKPKPVRPPAKKKTRIPRKRAIPRYMPGTFDVMAHRWILTEEGEDG